MDVALDDLIKTNRRGGGRGGRRGGRSDDRTGGGAFRRSRNNQRNTPYKSNRDNRGNGNSEDVWEHDKFDDEEEEEEFVDTPAPRTLSSSGGLETGAKLQITNLAFSVSDDDIKDLFEPLGDIKKAFIQYDKSGRSNGSATVIYARKASALEAIKKYNNVPLDNSPMKISLVATTGGAGAGERRAPRQQQDGGLRSFRRAVDDAERVTINVPGGRSGRRVVVGGGAGGRQLRVGGRAAGGAGGRQGGRGGRGGRGGSGGRGRGGRSAGGGRQVTKEELDAEMDEYAAGGDE